MGKRARLAARAGNWGVWVNFFSCLALLDLVLYFLRHLLQQNVRPLCTSLTCLFSTLVLQQFLRQLGQSFAPRGAEGFGHKALSSLCLLWPSRSTSSKATTVGTDRGERGW